MVTSPHGDDHHDQTLINHFINQPVSRIAQLDFVSVFQIAVQLGGRDMRSLQSLGQLLFEQGLDGAV